MPTDKKISELPVATTINGSDVSVLVDSSTDYQYTFTLLLQFLEANITVGAGITFGTTLPQNTAGSNGDVFVNTAAGSFAQKFPVPGPSFIHSRQPMPPTAPSFSVPGCRDHQPEKIPIVILTP